MGYVNCRNIDLFKDLPNLVSKQTPLASSVGADCIRVCIYVLPRAVGGHCTTKRLAQVAFHRIEKQASKTQAATAEGGVCQQLFQLENKVH